MEYSALQEEAIDYVFEYMKQHPVPERSFHNQAHTQDVIEAAKKIGTHYRLNDKDSCIVLLAASFHDVGYCSGDATRHEERSAELAQLFLNEKGVDEKIISSVKQCILATRIPQRPTNLLEEIVCDADLYHLGTNRFQERNRLMRKEAELSGDGKTKSEWRRQTIELMEQHSYHTTFCKQLLSSKKRENLDKLIQKELDKMIQKENEQENRDDESLLVVQSPAKKPDKKDRDSRPDKGIETMFRITSGNNQRLSDMADNKAHILITVNSIILSAVITLLLRKLENNVYLMYPTFILLTVSLCTIVVAILATRPSVPAGTFDPKDLEEKTVNLLFFGNFYKMSLDSYSQGMNLVMNDREFLYGTLIKDVYSQGVVLGRKYLLLRRAYNIFMYGLITSVLAFIIAVFFS